MNEFLLCSPKLIQRFVLWLMLVTLVSAKVVLAEPKNLQASSSTAWFCKFPQGHQQVRFSQRGKRYSIWLSPFDRVEKGESYTSGEQRAGAMKFSPVAAVSSGHVLSLSLFSRSGALKVADLVFLGDGLVTETEHCLRGKVRVLWQSRGGGVCAEQGYHGKPEQQPMRFGKSWGQPQVFGSGRLVQSTVLKPLVAEARRPEVAVAAEIDAEFVAAHHGRKRALRAVRAAVHSADVLYLDQLGVNLRIRDRHSFTDRRTQPFNSSDAQELIEQFRSYTAKHHQVRGDVKLLFTGKDLTVSGNSGVAGLAYTGVVCSRPRYSFGVVERANKALQTVLFAHELGHLLGALHANDVESIMSPVVRGSYDRFSPQSIQEMRSQIESYPACL